MVKLFGLLVAALQLIGCASSAPARDSVSARVQSLIDQAVGSATKQEKAFLQLEELGDSAVPYLVGSLGDLRQLKNPHISLSNSAPDAFEAYRHYGPKTVHDAVAAILNQITGQSFGFVYNGATDVERKSNRSAWVAWCKESYPAHAAKCDGI